MPANAKPDKITAHVLACGAMHCDLTWLPLQPGRVIRELRIAPAGSYS